MEAPRPLRRWSRIVALLLLGVAAALLLVARLGGAASPRSASSIGHVHRFAWPSGSRSVYSVRWDARSRRTLLGGNAQGDASGGSLFDGEISVRSLGVDAEGLTTLVYGIDEVRGYDVRLGAQDLLSEADRKLAIAALHGREAFVHVDDLGGVRSIGYHHDAPASTRDLLRRLVDMMRVTLPADPHASMWTAQEPTPNGLAHVRYDEDGDALHRMRLSYDGLAGMVGPGESSQQLSSRSTIELDSKSAVRSIDDLEELDVHGPQGVFSSRWTFKATRASSDTFEVATIHTGDIDDGSGEDQLARDRQRGRDERLSQGWDLGAIELELLVAGKGKHYKPSFVAEAAAFVRGHPEACVNLVTWFQDARMTDLARQLTLDVLSAAGSDQAQEAMRQALASQTAKRSPERGAMIQRFVFVRTPNPDSARFVARVYDDARAAGDADMSFAAAVSLGAIIGHMEGNDDLAMDLDAHLRANLAERRSPAEAVALLRALGNAGQDEDLPAVLAFAGDEYPRVREQVARSLRFFDDVTASRELLTLATDSAQQVERAAFRALREQTLDDQDWEALARDVQGDRTSAYADRALVDLIERRPDVGPRAEIMLRAIADRTPDTDGTVDLRERIAGALERARESSPL